MTSGRVARVDEEEVFSCDALFLCVAISSMREVLERIAPRLSVGTVVLDTCSVKVTPIELMTTLLDPATEIIGTHPMFGPDSGRHGVEGLPICFCPVRAAPSTIETLRSVFVSMGLRVHDLSPDEHDRKAAYTQGITHFVGRVLELLHLEPSEIGTLGYAKLLEIVDQTCHDPMQLFYDLQRYNPYTDEMRRRLSDAFDRVRSALESGNLDTTSVTNVQ